MKLLLSVDNHVNCYICHEFNLNLFLIYFLFKTCSFTKKMEDIDIYITRGKNKYKEIL